MPASSQEKEFVTYILDLMQSVGPVRAKRMFGGYGLSLDGLTFAIITDNTLYLKVDRSNEADFITKGLPAFSYPRQGREIKMSYYQAPEEALEDPALMNDWSNKAYLAALRAAQKK